MKKKEKNPDLSEFRVAVVPCNETNNIDQNSDVDRILNCSDTVLYPITDFFKAQNDEELPKSYWSFLIRINDYSDWTGSNIIGIHQ